MKINRKKISTPLPNRPMIRLKKIVLQNIGHFQNLSLDLDRDCSVLIGFNGTGKTTILRSLALAITGWSENIDMEVAESLLRITKRKGNKTQYEKGKILLEVEVDEKVLSNEILFTPNIEKEKIEVQGDRFLPLYEKENLKNLMIGFGQRRSLDAKKKRTLPFLKSNDPKSGDLFPLIHNESQEMLNSFISWIANLEFEAQKGAPENRELIQMAFRIFSEIAEDEVSFDEITRIDPLEVWIKTKESPQGIPYYLVSLGWQNLMGWVGYLLQRMFEANEEVKNFCESPGVVIIDEIDSFLHPKWQQKILTVLRKHFPQTQFIATTHSPLIIDGLEQGQVYHLAFEKTEIIAKVNTVDIWAWNYLDIMTHFFQTHQEQQKYEEWILPEINRLKQLKSPATQEEQRLRVLEEDLRRIYTSRASADEVFAIRKRLEEKENKLTKILEQYGVGK